MCASVLRAAAASIVASTGLVAHQRQSLARS